MLGGGSNAVAVSPAWPNLPRLKEVFCFFFSKKKRLLKSLFAFRDARLADPRFHAFAARFPLTRPIARREARAYLAQRCQLTESAMLTLLNAATSLRLVAKSGSEYRLGQLGAALRGNPGVTAMVKHHRLFYADLADPAALLRGDAETNLSKFWPYHGSPGDAAGYSALMAASQPMIAAEILAAATGLFCATSRRVRRRRG